MLRTFVQAQIRSRRADQLEDEVQGVDEDEVADAPLARGRARRRPPVAAGSAATRDATGRSGAGRTRDQSFSSGGTIDEIQPTSGMGQEPHFAAQQPAVEPLVELAQEGAGIESSSTAARSPNSRSQNSARSTGRDSRTPGCGYRRPKSASAGLGTSMVAKIRSPARRSYNSRSPSMTSAASRFVGQHAHHVFNRFTNKLQSSDGNTVACERTIPRGFSR